jgi:hypothetical protein
VLVAYLWELIDDTGLNPCQQVAENLLAVQALLQDFDQAEDLSAITVQQSMLDHQAMHHLAQGALSFLLKLEGGNKARPMLSSKASK